MNLQWIVLIVSGFLAMQANAEQPVVIDAQAIAGEDAQGQAQTGSLQDANKERIMKGGRMSPKQQYEIEMSKLADSNKRSGEDYLAANLAKPGVVSLPDGVQYKVLRAGKGGRKPTDSGTIQCRYQGSLIDGMVFEKSDLKKPETLKVAGLLPGLREAVKLMTAGAKWQIIVPPQLGYGAKGNRTIAPNSVLIYDIEIIAVK